MYRGGRGRRGNYRGGRGSPRGGKSTSTTTANPKGLFVEGTWQCNCTPRLPAQHFKVKKEGKNQGRWFYTCQNSEPKRCGFFLWDEDAKTREEAAVLSGRRTEPGAAVGEAGARMSLGGSAVVQEGWDAGRAARAARTDAMGARGGSGGRGRGLFAQQGGGRGTVRAEDGETQSPSPRRISPPPPYTVMPSGSNAKRNAQQAGMDEEDDDQLFPWPLTGQEEQALAQAADHTTAPQTPHKAQKTGVYATPATTVGRKLPWLEQRQAPKTPITTTNATGYFDTPSKSTGTTASPATLQSVTTPHQNPIINPAVAAKTPSPPTRHKDALVDPADTTSTLTTSALTLLEPINLPPSTLTSLRTLLTKHDLKTEGVAKGREIARLAVKAKEAKIAELEAKIAGLENAKIAELRTRIASLEAEREVDRGVVRRLRWQVAQGGGDVGGEGMDSQETVV